MMTWCTHRSIEEEHGDWIVEEVDYGQSSCLVSVAIIRIMIIGVVNHHYHGHDYLHDQIDHNDKTEDHWITLVAPIETSARMYGGT